MIEHENDALNVQRSRKAHDEKCEARSDEIETVPEGSQIEPDANVGTETAQLDQDNHRQHGVQRDPGARDHRRRGAAPEEDGGDDDDHRLGARSDHLAARVGARRSVEPNDEAQRNRE